MFDINDPTVAVAVLSFLAIGGTELVKQAFANNWKAVVIIVVSTVIGGLGGAFLVPIVGGVAGLVVGLSASGLVTGFQKIGQGTTSLPSQQ
jgi:ABC-type transport system involved in cytochrome c biogenesis permease subunit